LAGESLKQRNRTNEIQRNLTDEERYLTFWS